jgi:beta-glucosidase
MVRCNHAKPHSSKGPSMPAPAIAARIDTIIASATLAEKVGMMSGKGFFAAYREDGGVWGSRPYRAGSGIERLGVEPLYFTDGPRGVARGNSTCFPCTMARGASFDVDLERRIGEAMGIEIRAQGCTLSGAVCINLLRHPAWGRAQETYGEDQHHLGVMGAALGTGIQTHNVIATVKHFALNSMENARFTVDVRVDERTLHEVYLPHFKTCIDAGIASVMSAYNKVNGEYCGENRALLTDILRGEWGFTGFVHSDWVMGVYTVHGATAGLDIENPEPLVFGDKLIAAVESGTVAPQVIDTACRRILETQLRFAAAADPLPAYPMSLVARAAHRALALEAAEKSAVLLENNGVLPLVKGARLAVLGRLAALANTGDNGSSRVRPPEVVTVLDGLRAYCGDAAITVGDEDDLAAAQAVARAADAVIVVVGYTAEEEGEFIPGDIALGQAGSAAGARPRAIGGDRTDLGLPPRQVALIDAAVSSGVPVIVLMVCGSAVLVEGWRAGAAAIMQTFYAGMAGGTAIARLVFGDVSPGGKLPFTVARDAGDYPFFDRDAQAIDYDYWHGYAKFDHEGRIPRYSFGHGLTYGEFSFSEIIVRQNDTSVAVTVTLRNAGGRAAREVVQLYVAYPGTVTPRPLKALKAFACLDFLPGETRTITLSIALADLCYRDPDTHTWRLERGAHRILVGSASDAIALEAAIVL